MKKIAVCLLLVLLCSALVIGVLSDANAQSAKAKIVLKKYPSFKIGLLANNFINPLPLSKDNMKKVMDWASANGFAWIEIRDPNATLTYAECKELAAYAVSKNLEVIYALNIGPLDPQFNEAFYRGCANAVLFAANGPRVIRTSLPGPEFAADPKKTVWGKDEFEKILAITNNAANVAKSFGLLLTLEHAYEAQQGDGMYTFGMMEVQTKGNSNIGSQYDLANFFAVSRAPVSPEAARSYFEKFAYKTGYVHVKTSKKGVVQDVLSDNDLDYGIIFDILAKAKISYLGIELPQKATFEEEAANLLKSVEYLKSKF